ncbi:MAG: hypothetical protein ACXIUV_06905 [Alkalilacustris sp.]
MTRPSGFGDRVRGLWQAQRIKAWVRRHLGLGSEVLVMVAEVPCPDPRCRGPATTISVLGLDLTALRWTLHKPAADLREADIAALMGDIGPPRRR